jgi:adenylate cyclase
MGFASGWLANLPRPVAAALTISAFLILINLFSNSNRIWFHWPVAAILFSVILVRVLRRGERRTSRD